MGASQPQEAHPENQDFSLPVPSSLSELREYCTSEKFNKLLEALFNIEDQNEKAKLVLQLKEWEAEQKSSFHPENNHIRLKELKQQATNPENQDQEAKRKILLEIGEIRTSIASELQQYEQTMNIMQRKVASVANSGSGRSNRAKRAGLVSKHAGKNVIENAPTDKFGNPLGTEYDLGVDGAFNEMEIIVFNICSINNTHASKAFAQKGFKYQWHNRFPPAKEMKSMLEREQVCQVWVISGGAQTISVEQVEIIRDFHKSGRSLYIWGDNLPLYVDANIILTALFGSELEMFGDVLGDHVVHLTSGDGEGKTDNKGFISHMITTGMQHLYEGITVASFDEKAIRTKGFSPLMWGSAGNLITIYREADEEGGAVMCDGAFTRLFYKVDDAGTIRYIINAACWLAIESVGSTPTFELPDDKELDEIENYEEAGAFSKGICSLTWDPIPVAYLSMMELADPERNTCDLVLNDPMGYGEKNVSIMGRNLYSKIAGETVLDMGKDPYLRRPVVGLLPAVSLKHSINRKLFTEELCRVFMGRKALYSQAQLLFVGVLDSVLDPCRVGNYDELIVDVVKFMLEESLTHFRSTPDFSDVGDKIPLIEAMQQYFTVSPELVMINRSFTTVCLIGRFLMARNLISAPDACVIARRSFYKFLISNTIQLAKQENKDQIASTLSDKINEICYQTWNKIPLSNSGRIMETLPNFIPCSYKAPMERFESQGGKIFNGASVTFVFIKLMQEDLCKWKVEQLIERFLKDPLFKNIWSGKDMDEGEVIAILNEIFKGFKVSESHAPVKIIPFATTLGPTVFSCSKCGFVFGDYKAEPTETNSELIKKARNAHFVEHFNSDINGYPTNSSSHYSLHRTIQTVMRENFPNETKLCPEMVSVVADRLRKVNKGNYFRAEIETVFPAVIESYLVCKAKGQEHAPAYIQFHDRLIAERKMLLNQ
eukprot:CAMPEP_0117024848 /NCGR_PEP_ID=MMETSP0472-20121206/18415_1 /TAXON_ID=693140 ORGANISM="Tiarina fusus, Strain LIS" /NCGR_SAMPLE_ID=MMETSP0472 /ASSEMBLY_ACC=CAM_ASM_000603 /LENGTH=941 /DNA_ID=CAMNT_0004731401 /DNA_START=19 /DNA_END=2844 /DNA_ORIENTATION=-